MNSGPNSAASEKYDRLYRAWMQRQGPRGRDLEWRMTRLLWRHRALLRRYPPAGKRVLDFGCMDGVFTLKAQELGGEAVGYDVSPEAIAQAEVFRGARARPAFTTTPPDPGRFDLVYCQEVIEHVEDDSTLIGELVSYLAPGGLVVGTAPVGNYFWDPDHKHVYDEALSGGRWRRGARFACTATTEPLFVTFSRSDRTGQPSSFSRSRHLLLRTHTDRVGRTA